jgi:hypothetical protein
MLGQSITRPRSCEERRRRSLVLLPAKVEPSGATALRAVRRREHQHDYTQLQRHGARSGNPYFLAWCPFHFTGEKTSPASAGSPRDQSMSNRPKSRFRKVTDGCGTEQSVVA